MSKRKKAYRGEFPLAYSRYSRSHWILYVRRLTRIRGYSYRKKYKRRWKVIHVSAYTVISYVEHSREAYDTPAAWITAKEWLTRIENKYENFDRSRSDLPTSKEKWFRLKNNFLWYKRRYPPFGPDAEYTLVILYLLIWDPADKLHKLYTQKLMTIRRHFSATDTDERQNTLAQIEARLLERAGEQSKKLERSGFDTEGVDVKGLVAWTVVPKVEWWIKEEKRLEKRHRYWARRDKQELARRLRRKRRKAK